MSEKISQATGPREAVPDGELVADEAEVALEVGLERETVWPAQREMAGVFRMSSDNVSFHLKNVFADGELDRAASTEDCLGSSIGGRPAGPPRADALQRRRDQLGRLQG